MNLWKGLVVLQFALTNLLILGSWIVFKQLTYMKNKQLGFQADRVIVIPIRDELM